MSAVFQDLKASNLPSHPIIIVNGKTRAGKSTLMLHLFNLMGRDAGHTFKSGLVFCPSASFRAVMSKYMPKAFIYDRFDEDVLKNFINLRRMKANRGETLDHAFFMADDCMHDKAINKSASMAELFKVGRQYNITRVVAVHSAKDLSDKLRGQTDVYILPALKVPDEIDKLYGCVGAAFNSKAHFRTLFAQMTKNFSAMAVLMTNNASEGITDEVFWCRGDHTDVQLAQQKANPLLVGSRALFLVSNAYYSNDLSDQGSGNNGVVLAGDKEQREKAAQRLAELERAAAATTAAQASTKRKADQPVAGGASTGSGSLRKQSRAGGAPPRMQLSEDRSPSMLPPRIPKQSLAIAVARGGNANAAFASSQRPTAGAAVAESRRFAVQSVAGAKTRALVQKQSVRRSLQQGGAMPPPPPPPSSQRAGLSSVLHV
jgi:hypothetical protein